MNDGTEITSSEKEKHLIPSSCMESEQSRKGSKKAYKAKGQLGDGAISVNWCLLRVAPCSRLSGLIPNTRYSSL